MESASPSISFTATRERDRKSGRWWALSLLLVGWFTLLMMPGNANPTGPCLDCGWIWGVNLAHQGHLVFGRDVMFTYGPWGRFVYPTFPQTDLYAHLAALAAMTLFYGLGLVLLLWRVAGGWRALLTVSLVQMIALIAYRSHVESAELVALTFALALMANEDARWPWLEVIGLSLATGIGLVVKTNQFVLGFALTTLMIAWAVWQRRHTLRGSLFNGALSLLLLAASGPLMFQLATGQLGSLPGYLRGTAELMRGYSESMSLQGSFAVYTLAVMSVVALFVVIPATSEEKWRLWPAFPPAAVLGFIAFRHAMTREDRHAMPFLARLALAGLFFFVIARTRRTRVILAVFCLLASLQSAAYFVEDSPDYWFELVGRFKMERIRLAWNDLTHGERQTRINDEVSQILLRKSQTLSDAQLALVRGHSAECVPYDTYLPYANGLTWNPRPIFQTYSAYTPFLDQWNARHIREQGAERIIIHTGVIDQRAQLWEDPASTLATIDRYDVLDLSSGRLILGRRATPRLGRVHPVNTGQLAWNQPLTLTPPSPTQLRLLKLHVTPSWLGRILNYVTRTPAVQMRITLSNGRTVTHRAVFPNLSAGIPVDTLPEELNQMVPLFDGPSAGDYATVRSIALETTSPAAFQPGIQFEQLTIDRRDQPVPVVSSAATPLWKPGQPVTTNGSLATLSATSLTWQATGELIEFYVPLPPGPVSTIRLRLRYAGVQQIAFSIGSMGWQEDLPGSSRWTDVYVRANVPATPASRFLRVALGAKPGDWLELSGIDRIDGPPPNPHREIFIQQSPSQEP